MTPIYYQSGHWQSVVCFCLFVCLLKMSYEPWILSSPPHLGLFWLLIECEFRSITKWLFIVSLVIWDWYSDPQTEVDTEPFLAGREIEQSLAAHNTTPCLQWCYENRSRLKKSKVSKKGSPRENVTEDSFSCSWSRIITQSASRWTTAAWAFKTLLQQLHCVCDTAA